jgi:hypothetical protein
MASGKKVFLYGCAGCAGVVGLLLIGAAVLAGVAWVQVGREQIAEEVATQPLPESRAFDVAGAEPPAPTPEPGRVLIDLQRVEVEIEPASAGEPMRVEAKYDKSSYTLEERLQREEGQPGWTYEVRFSSSVPNIILGLRQLFGGSQPRVRVFLPADVPLDLQVHLSQGGGRVDLGGMWLTELDLELRQGGFQVEVDEPLRQPVERVSLKGSMGGMEISRLGNASPRQLDVDLQMGGMELDLRGEWVADARISLRTRMGGTVLRLPRRVRIEGLEGAPLQPPESTEIPLPVLRFDVTTHRGEIEILP